MIEFDIRCLPGEDPLSCLEISLNERAIQWYVTFVVEAPPLYIKESELRVEMGLEDSRVDLLMQFPFGGMFHYHAGKIYSLSEFPDAVTIEERIYRAYSLPIPRSLVYSSLHNEENPF